MPERPLHPARRDHLEVLRGPHGIWQHASGTVPEMQHGSCTDDVARALVVDLLHARVLGWGAVRADAWRSITFLGDAQDPASGAFRNLRSADGRWLERVGSPDSQGRAIFALGFAVAEAPDRDLVAQASRVLAGTHLAVRRLHDLRAVSSSLLGCDAAIRGGVTGEPGVTLGILADRLRQAFSGIDLGSDWPWPEPVLTYESALLPRAFIVAGERLADRDLVNTGLRVLDWILRVQSTPDGVFSPVGCAAWWPRGGTRSTFDQQPIEATAVVLAAVAGLRATGDDRYRQAAEAAYAWFLGSNDLAVEVAIPATGGCHDGLTPHGVNENQGAESSLMWLTALEEIRMIRTSTTPRVIADSRLTGKALAGSPS